MFIVVWHELVISDFLISAQSRHTTINHYLHILVELNFMLTISTGRPSFLVRIGRPLLYGLKMIVILSWLDMCTEPSGPLGHPGHRPLLYRLGIIIILGHDLTCLLSRPILPDIQYTFPTKIRWSRNYG